MEAEIKNRFGKAILTETAQRYRVAVESIRELDAFESFIYEFEREGRPTILRLGHSRRRTPELILGEVDWLNYLARGGAAVVSAVESANGRLVEQIPDGHGDHFLATAFVKAPGGPPQRDNGHWPAALTEAWGQAIGRMHALTTTYVVPDPAWRRPNWDAPEIIDVDSWLPPQQTAVRQRYRELLDTLYRLPQTHDVYGLVHTDAHQGNFFVERGDELTFFDFDDCSYTWFANDIAIVLFYALGRAKDSTAFAKRFLRHFLRGYRQAYPFDAAWLTHFPAFLKLREIELYAVIYRSFDDPLSTDDVWVQNFMNGRQRRIENNIPYLDVDFDSLAKELT